MLVEEILRDVGFEVAVRQAEEGWLFGLFFGFEEDQNWEDLVLSRYSSEE